LAHPAEKSGYAENMPEKEQRKNKQQINPVEHSGLRTVRI